MRRPRAPLRAFFARYGLDVPTGLHAVDSGLLNRSYQVTSGGYDYFLKHYLPWRGPGLGLPDADGRPRTRGETLRWQHEAALRLVALGIPATAPLRDLRGRTVSYVRGRAFALYPWSDGVHRYGDDIEEPDAHHLGNLLASIHSGLERVLAPVPQPLFVPTKSEQKAVSEAEQLLALISARPSPDAMDELSEHRLRERLELIPKVAHLRPGPDALSTVGYIHGDFHAGNVMWTSTGPRSRISAVVDWEKTAVGPCGDEVVHAALVFFTDRGTGQLDLDLVRAFIDGYTTERPEFSESELRASVRRVWWERLTDFWILVWRYRHADERADSLFPATAALVPWWTENYDKVLDAFLDGAAAAEDRRGYR